MSLINSCRLGLHTFYTLHLVRFRSFFLHAKLHAFTHFLHIVLPRFQLIISSISVGFELNLNWTMQF